MESVKVLIFEDDTVSAKNLEFELKLLGHRVAGISSGGDNATKLVDDLSPDIILMDINLQGQCDGISLAEKINERSDVPIIFVSALEDEETLRKVKKVNPSAYLVKPVNKKDLMSAIEIAVYKHSMENKLRTTEARYSDIINLISEFICRIDGDGNITYINGSFANYLGIDESASVNFFDLIDPEYRSTVIDSLEKLGSSTTYNCEFSTSPKGEKCWQSWNFKSAMSQPQGTKEFQGVGKDITARKQSDDMLKYHFNIIEQVSDAIIATDTTPQKNVLAWNHGAEWIYGWTKEEAVGRPVLDLFSGRPNDKPMADIFREIEGQGQFRGELYQYRKGGSPVIVEANIMPMHDTSGNYNGWVAVLRDITVRKQAEEALKMSEERLSLALEATNDAIWDWNIHTGHVYFSPRYFEMLGYKFNGFASCYESWVRLLHPDDRALAVKTMDDILIHGDNYRIEYRMLTKQGGGIWIEERGKVVERGSKFGTAKRLIGTHTDVTERKKAELLLRESETRYKTLFEDSPISLWEINFSYLKKKLNKLKNSGVTDINAEFDRAPLLFEELAGSVYVNDINKQTLEIFEVKDKTAFRLNFVRILNRYYRDAFRQTVASLYNGMSELQIEHHSAEINGKAKHFYSKIILVPGHLEDWSKAIITVIDITDRIKAQLEYLKTQEKFMKAFSSGPEMMTISTFQEGRYIEVNDKFLLGTGYSRGEVIGKTAPELNLWVSPDARASIKHRLITSGEIKNAENLVRLKNGDIITVLHSFELLELDDELCVISSLLDISDRKKAEREREESVKALIRAEKERNEARRLIDQSSRLASIGVIAGGITHEINQPLNAIKTGADGMLFWDRNNNGILPPKITKMLGGISDAAQRIDDIIQHMRSYWIDSSKSELGPTNLNKTIERALSLIIHRLHSHQISLILDLSPGNLIVKANVTQLELVINNLVVNASIALDEVEGRARKISVKTYSIDDAIMLEVADNGIGLPDVNPAQLFDPFFSTRKNKQGTGLGLAIVKMFLDKFNADVSAENNAEGGATFCIKFSRVPEKK